MHRPASKFSRPNLKKQNSDFIAKTADPPRFSPARPYVVVGEGQRRMQLNPRHVATDAVALRANIRVHVGRGMAGAAPGIVIVPDRPAGHPGALHDR